jgi:hypothetical protein
MFENDNDMVRLHREVGAIKHDLLISTNQVQDEESEKYCLATKIDLTVSRLIRLMDKVEISTP